MVTVNRHRCIRAALQICLLCLSILICPRPSAHSQATQVNDQSVILQLMIRTEKKNYVRGELVPVYVQLTNVSRRDVIVGRDMWTNDSPSRVRLAVSAIDGHNFRGLGGAVDGPAPDAFRDLPKAVLAWCLSLPPGYSYGSKTSLQSFVDEAGLTPGVYVVRASFESRGVDVGSYFNPLQDNPTELAALRAQDWEGVISSNQLTIRIASDKRR